MAKCRDCKNCIHYSLCNYEEICHYDIDNIKNAKDCSFFKDRSRFVELPCKVGDTVYLLHNVYNNILAYSISKILINSGEPIIEIVEAERRIHTLQLPARKLKSLFLTKEQAEEALKERESNAERNDT